MAAADPITAAILPSDMASSDSWDANVPIPGPISIPDSNNILAELSNVMYTSAMNTPVPSADGVSSPTSEDADGLFRTAASKHGMKRAFPHHALPHTPAPVADRPFAKKLKTGKIEAAFVTEPVTPNTRSKPMPLGVTRIAVPAPLSPTSQSLCTDEADEVASMPPTPVPADLNALPTFSKEQTAKRRALRRAALKRNRSRKEEGTTVVKCEPTTKSESEIGQTGEPLDKKAARAIRNREAAMKSRVEAKQKMRKLQDENQALSCKVKMLNEEKDVLTSQLRSLLQHTLRVQVAEGQDVKEVFNAFARMTNRSV